jgi:Ni/Co efflux regulator RcnB
MRYRFTKTLIALTAISAFALPGVAQARHGADDGPAHVRHAHHHVRHHTRHHARHVNNGVHRARHGADDGANHR